MHSRRKQRSKTTQLKSEINVTPFVDVMLVLLIIFMVSEPLLVNGVPLDLPKAEATALDSNVKPITVSLDEKGNLYLDNNLCSNPEQLIEELNHKINPADKNTQQIFVRGAKEVPYQSILKFLALLQKNNFTKISLLSLVP